MPLFLIHKVLNFILLLNILLTIKYVQMNPKNRIYVIQILKKNSDYANIIYVLNTFDISSVNISYEISL